MLDDDQRHTLLEIYGELGRQVAAELNASGALHAVTTVAARSIGGVDAASITRGLPSGSWETVASTSDVATRADDIQYQLGSGPCVDAVIKDHVFFSPDITTDQRWPTFGPVVAESAGVHSVLSNRLTLDDEQAMAGLNLYSLRRDAFDDQALQLATLLATHAGVIISGMLAKQKAANLEIALISSRDIGVAIGILMTRYQISRDEAFDLMRMASQRAHRKLRDIAVDVAETGTLEMPH